MRIVMLEPLGIGEDKIRELSAPLVETGHEFVTFDSRAEDSETLISRSLGADILLVSNLPLKREVISTNPKIRMISVAFTGVDHLDAAACREKGIKVCNAAGYSTNSVAELAFGFMISLYRRVIPCDAATREGRTRTGLIGFDLYGKTLGIVGTGAIGTRVAEIGSAFGCKLLAFSRTHRDEVKKLRASYVSLEELFSKSDIVTLHLPLNDQSRLLVNRERISLMKSSAILINTARGPIVDSSALAEALNEGRIAGAGIDVFEREPPISGDHPLLHSKNTVVAPHVAFATHEALYRRAEIAFDNIIAFLNGSPKNVII